jgi:hypothetical protein
MDKYWITLSLAKRAGLAQLVSVRTERVSRNH